MSTKPSTDAVAPVRETPGSIIDRHIALIVSAGTIVAFAIRIILVAHGSPVTTLALIQASTPTAVLLPLVATSLASTLAGALAVIGPSILCDARTRPAWAEPVALRAIAWAACLLPAFFLLMATTTIVYIVLTPLWLWAGPTEARAWADIRRKAEDGDRKAQRRLERRQRSQASSWTSWLVTFGLLYGAISLLNDVPWLPSERIATSDDDFVGYVIRESDNELVLLLDNGREVVRVPNDSHVTRTICTTQGDGRTLAQSTLWRTTTPDYPDCADKR